MRFTEGDNIATLWQRLRRSPLQGVTWLALAQCYAALDLVWQAGYAARQAHRLAPDLLAQLEALQLDTWHDASAGDGLLGRPTLDGIAEVVAQYAMHLRGCPGDWLTWLYSARLQEMQAQVGLVQQDVARTALANAVRLEPIAGESQHWAGVWRLHAGDAPGAVAALAQLLDVRPVRYGSMMTLGEALERVGQRVAAQKAFTRASLSNNPDFLLLLSAKVYAYNYWQEAIEVLNKALGLRPDSVPILLALAKIQSEVYALADCSKTLDRIGALDPNNREAQLLSSALPGRMGDAKAHLHGMQVALATGGDPLSRLASSVAMSALYQDDLPNAEVAQMHRRLCAPIEARVVRKTVFGNPRTTARRLRLGYVTGDLHRQHPVNLFMLPVLLRHDHGQFEVCIYHTGTMHDVYTQQARACADRWLEAAALSDAALQQAIVDDGVDVLVDLAGHTASHRLGVLAMRAAPVQATFLGYPHSTGLSTIDWFIGDAVTSPREHAHLFSEGIAQLPHSVFCWAPVDSYPLPPARAPHEPVVFGSFNNAMKLSPRTVALWSRILHAVPGSQLLLKAPALGDVGVQERFVGLFAQHGIAGARLLLRGPSGLADMMQAYGDIDIALDPTPYNGGTTTLQALWMGVPVVALAGGNFVSRMGASFMATLGQPAWVADDEDAYVAAAVALAGTSAALRNQRSALRERMAASPLCDIAGYVAHYEALLQRMWACYCQDPPGNDLAALVPSARWIAASP